MPDRDALLARYRELVDRELPAAAARDRWTLRHDHCFARVLLDDAVRRLLVRRPRPGAGRGLPPPR